MPYPNSSEFFRYPQSKAVVWRPSTAPRIHRLPQRTDYILIPAPLGMFHLDNILSIWSNLSRLIPFWSNRKVATACHHRYALFSVIISRFFHRIPRRSSKAFSTRSYCILETLWQSALVQDSFYPDRSIHPLRFHVPSCCGSSGSAAPLLWVGYADQ